MKNEKVLLSIIVPVYNGELYIKDTLCQILSSDYQNIEVIVVDDGSKDSSVSIINSVAEKDTRVKLFCKCNGGVVSARNFGIEHSNGVYIGFADQDDFIKTFMYSKLIEKIEIDNSDMAMCSSGRNIEGRESAFDILQDGTYYGDDIYKKLLFPILFNGFDMPFDYDKTSHYPHIWTCLFKKSFIDENKIKFRSYVNFEDDFLVKVEALSKAKCVSTIKEIGYCWRVNLKSESYAHHFIKDIGKKQDKEYNDIVSSLSNINPSHQVINGIRQVIYCKQYVNAIHNLSSKEIKKNFAFIERYCKDNIYNRDFDEAIEGIRYLNRGQVKLSLILPTLKKHKTIKAYFEEIILDAILLITLHNNFLTKIERLMKK